MEEPWDCLGALFPNGKPFGLPVFTPNGTTPAKDGGCHLSGVVRCGCEMIFPLEGSPTKPMVVRHWLGKKTMYAGSQPPFKEWCFLLDDDKSLQNY